MVMVDMGDQYSDAGWLIRTRRESMGFTQTDIVDRLRQRGFDISKSAYSRLEQGGTRLHWADSNFLRELADILDISVAELLKATGHMQFRDLDTSVQRIVELVAELDEDGRETAEQLLKVLVSQQKKAEQG